MRNSATDKGYVFIDATGTSEDYGPPDADAVVGDVEVGKEYNPKYFFPSSGWYIPEGSMGTVASVFITWDGEWRS